MSSSTMSSSMVLCRIFRTVAVCAVLAFIVALLVTQRWSDDGSQLFQAELQQWRAQQAADTEQGGPVGPDGVRRKSSATSHADEGDRFAIRNGDPGRLELPVSEILMTDLIPPDVHFLWCGQNWFEFKNYLSVMSVRRAIQPDKIYIHFENQPTYDRVFYHQWLEELKFDYPWLYLGLMDDKLREFCSSTCSRERRLFLLGDLLGIEGGMYVGPGTWILNMPPSYRSVDVDLGLDADYAIEGYLILRPGVVNATFGVAQALNVANPPRPRRRSTCGRIHHIFHRPDIVNRTGACLVVAGDGFDRFYPMDIWDREDDFGRLVRKLFYGTELIRKPLPSYDELVPNIAHMIWIGGGRVSYVFYLSIISLLYVANMEVVYIHGDVPPTGEYWQEIMTLPQTKDRVKFIRRSLQLRVYQGNIPPWWAALQSDLIRVDLMIKYGGVYTDTDAIWVKPLSVKERGYDAVASYDWVDWSWPFPDSVNFGVSYGKRSAPFWRVFRDSMRRLRNDIHGFTGVMMPYKLLEKYPHLLLIDRHLQVICYHSRCHPTYVHDYHNVTKDHVSMGYLRDWKNDIHAFHWTFPDPHELFNRSSLETSTGMFADIGRYVLQKAGLL